MSVKRNNDIHFSSGGMSTKKSCECCIPLMLQSAFKSIFADRRGLFENPKSSEHPVKKNPVGLTKSKTLPNLLASSESPNNPASGVQNSKPVATPQPVKNNKRVAAGMVNNTILFFLLFPRS